MALHHKKKNQIFKVGDLTKVKPVSILMKTLFDIHNFTSEQCIGLIDSASNHNAKDINNVNDEMYTVYYVMTSNGMHEMYDFDLEEVQYADKETRNTNSCS